MGRGRGGYGGGGRREGAERAFTSPDQTTLRKIFRGKDNIVSTQVDLFVDLFIFAGGCKEWAKRDSWSVAN